MHKSDVTICQHLLDMARRRHGLHGIPSQSLLVHCWSWYMHPLKYLNKPHILLRARLVILEYGKTSTCTNIDKDRKKLFTRTSIREEDSTNTCCSGISYQKKCLPRWPCLGASTCFTHMIRTDAGLYEPHWTTLKRNHWRHSMSWSLVAARRDVVPRASGKKLDWNALHFANAKENV